MNRVIEHEDAILQIKVPVPFPLKWVNSYVLKGEKGYTIIDPGLHTKEAEAFWQQVLHERGISFQEIEQIVLTHHHPDHYGLAGWFQMRSSAPVYMSETSYKQALQLWGFDGNINHKIIEMFQRHGMPSDKLQQMTPHLESFIALVSPQPQVQCLAPGEQWVMGDRSYLLIEASGHAMGQLLFYDPAEKNIFCGDQVIPKITPNVSLIPDSDENPLDSFLTSLQQLGQLSVSFAFPGHGNPFSTFKQRTQQIIDHHYERLNKILGLLSRPCSAYDICMSLFGEHLTIHQLRFAMSETLAHLVYLQKQGKLSTLEHHDHRCILFVVS